MMGNKMDDFHVAIGINDFKHKVIAICVHTDMGKCKKLSKARAIKYKCTEYKIFTLPDNSFIEKFRWWLLEHGLTELEIARIGKQFYEEFK